MTEVLYVYKGQEVRTEPSRFHTLVDHDYWMNRIGRCPYCHNGSTPVDKSLIVERLERLGR
jgi:hypothetical protein